MDTGLFLQGQFGVGTHSLSQEVPKAPVLLPVMLSDSSCMTGTTSCHLPPVILFTHSSYSAPGPGYTWPCLGVLSGRLGESWGAGDQIGLT